MRLLRPLLKHQGPALEASQAMADPFLAMAMRTGKTLVLIRDWRKRYPCGRILICAPLTVLIPWMQELAREQIEYFPLLSENPEDLRAIAEEGPSPGWFLIGPGALRNYPDIVRKHRWDAIGVDEATLMKNPQAEITRLLNHLQVQAETRGCLSGWPCPEGELDWFEQMRFVGHGRFMGCTNFWWWRYRYFKKYDYDWVPKRGTREAIARCLQGRVYFLTAEQAGMPDRFIEEPRYIEMSPAQLEIYQQVEKDFAASFEGHELSTKWIPVRDLRLHQIASGEVPWSDGSATHFHNKVHELVYLLNGELKNEKSIVVFFRFLEGVRACSAVLGRLGIGHRSIDGGVLLAKRMEALRGFRERRARVLLLQADCGRYALDLSCASVGIFYSLGHSFETFVQARQRLKHPKKKVSNLLLYLIAKGTVEERILPALGRKGQTGRYFMQEVYANLGR